eukprot:6319456-Amphidinium_carterae.1
MRDRFSHAAGLPGHNNPRTHDGLDGLNLWGTLASLYRGLPEQRGCSSGRHHRTRLAWGAQRGELGTGLGESNQRQSPHGEGG